MRFSYSAHLQHSFPERVTAVLSLDAVSPVADVAGAAAPFLTRAAARLAQDPESQFPEIQAWRRAYAKMGHKPTQIRCASEALLRRFRKDKSLPSIHPLIDLCNAASLSFAIPIAVFDRDRISGDMTVREATGSETYETFAGDVETPDPGEIIFADDEGTAHARRWANRQSKRSAVSPASRRALIVAEALHASAPTDITALAHALGAALTASFAQAPAISLLLSPGEIYDPARRGGVTNVD